MDDHDDFSIAMDLLFEQVKFFRRFKNYVAAGAFPDLRRALFEQMAVVGWSDDGRYSPQEAEARRRLRELLPVLNSESQIGVRTWRVIAADLRLPIPDSRDLTLGDAVAIGELLRHRPMPATAAAKPTRTDEPSDFDIVEARKLCTRDSKATKKKFMHDLQVGNAKALKLMDLMRSEGLLHTKARSKKN